MSGELPVKPVTPEPTIGQPTFMPDANAKVLRSVELFGNLRMIWIEHAGGLYRLSITSRGKLILQK